MCAVVASPRNHAPCPERTSTESPTVGHPYPNMHHRDMLQPRDLRTSLPVQHSCYAAAWLRLIYHRCGGDHFFSTILLLGDQCLVPQADDPHPPDDALDHGAHSSDHADHWLDFPAHSIVVIENLDSVRRKERPIANENAVSAAPFVSARYYRFPMRVHPTDSLPKLAQKPSFRLTQHPSASQLLAFSFYFRLVRA